MDIAGIEDATGGLVTAGRVRILPLALNLPSHSRCDIISYRVLGGEGYRLLCEPHLRRGTESDGVVRRVTDGVVEVAVVSGKRILVGKDMCRVSVVTDRVSKASQFRRRTAIISTLSLIDDDDGGVIDTRRPYRRRCWVSQQGVDIGVLDKGDGADTTVFDNGRVKARVTVVIRNSSPAAVG